MFRLVRVNVTQTRLRESTIRDGIPHTHTHTYKICTFPLGLCYEANSKILHASIYEKRGTCCCSRSLHTHTHNTHLYMYTRGVASRGTPFANYQPPTRRTPHTLSRHAHPLRSKQAQPTHTFTHTTTYQNHNAGAIVGTCKTPINIYFSVCVCVYCNRSRKSLARVLAHFARTNTKHTALSSVHDGWCPLWLYCIVVAFYSN